MSKQPPKRVRDCTRHFNGCQCREWRFEQMKQALLAIRELAAFEYTNDKYAGLALAHIANKAAEGLGE